ncbi:MAG: hypothetical protein JWM27_4752 [Gemmatimonadetes bacterium]|nr:hypothetical protein [Gemmatimonadota bacterium]
MSAATLVPGVVVAPAQVRTGGNRVSPMARVAEMDGGAALARYGRAGILNDALGSVLSTTYGITSLGAAVHVRAALRLPFPALTSGGRPVPAAELDGWADPWPLAPGGV